MASSVWTGYLTFGLISMPVRLFSGARGSRVSFNMLHREDHARVKQQMICSEDGQVLTREHISQHAWDDNYDPLSNVIDVYIGRLRRKIDVAGEPPMLETMRGAGYRLAAAAAR